MYLFKYSISYRLSKMFAFNIIAIAESTDYHTMTIFEVILFSLLINTIQYNILLINLTFICLLLLYWNQIKVDKVHFYDILYVFLIFI